MAAFPDEIWLHIMQIGVEQDFLTYRDLSCIAISSRRLSRLSSINSLWKSLWAKDFPSDAIPQEIPKNFKSFYKQKFERVKSAKTAAHKRLILRVQSRALVLERECKDLEALLDVEMQRLNSTCLELKKLERARQSSVALKIWQPEIVRIKEQNVVEQTKVPTDSRVHSLKMEISVCKEHVTRFSKSIHIKKSTMERAKRELEALTYKPFQDSCDESIFQMQPKKPKLMGKERRNLSNSTFAPCRDDMTYSIWRHQSSDC